MMDQILERAALRALDLEPSVELSRIRVTVRDGVATLTGDVETRAQKLVAKCRVEDVPGVREVIDDLKVCPSKKSQRGFEHIGDDVLNALFWDLAVPADRVSVKCENGWVTLTGEVERPYQKSCAEADVRKTRGVVGVINQIRVATNAQTETARRGEALNPTPAPSDNATHKFDRTKLMREYSDRYSGSARILVVDDIDSNREISAAYLEDTGYHVDTASSGVEAIQMLGCERYDLVLMDIQMPVMDGAAATKRVRAMPAPVKDIPIIAMTAHVLPQQVKSFLDAGMNDHVGKPIERATLYDNVRRWLPRTQALKTRIGSGSSNFDIVKFDEFVDVAGVERAERIATSFLKELTAAFPSQCTLAEAQQAAHALVNCAGVFGMGNLVVACRALEFVSRDDLDHQIVAMEDVRSEQSTARQILMGNLLPKLRETALMPTG